jgi:hypothetical protein
VFLESFRVEQHLEALLRSLHKVMVAPWAHSEVLLQLKIMNQL